MFWDLHDGRMQLCSYLGGRWVVSERDHGLIYRYIDIYIEVYGVTVLYSRVQELCESRGGRPGLPVLMSLMVSVDVKQH